MTVDELKQEETKIANQKEKILKSLKNTVSDEVEISLNVSETVNKNVIMATNLFTAYRDPEDGCIYIHTENSDVYDEYNEKFYSIPDLLKILSELAKEKADKSFMIGDRENYRKYSEIAEQSLDWERYDLEVSKDE